MAARRERRAQAAVQRSLRCIECHRSATHLPADFGKLVASGRWDGSAWCKLHAPPFPWARAIP